MKSELGKMEGNEVLNGTQDTYLIEQDVPDLVEFLVSGSQHAFKQEKRRMHCLEAQHTYTSGLTTSDDLYHKNAFLFC